MQCGCVLWQQHHTNFIWPFLLVLSTMKIKIRQEIKADHVAISDVIKAAYKDVSYSDKKEQFMVDRLRKSNAFVPELSLIAEDEYGNLAGHILLTKITIQNPHQSYAALALAPLSIKPEYQNKGVGTKLVMQSHAITKQLGYNYIVVLGHANYYPKFGYERTGKYNIEIPLKIAEENCMVISLIENGLKNVSGTVVYPKEFFG